MTILSISLVNHHWPLIGCYLGVQGFADHVTDREALLVGANLKPGLANLVRNLLADDVRHLYALLLSDGGALGGLHLGAHLLHPLPAGDLLDHLLSGLALRRLHEAAHLGLGLRADNLRDLYALILRVGGAPLLVHSETEILRGHHVIIRSHSNDH